MISKNNFKNSKGITLVVLAITIAVMFVLAAVTIGIMINNGIIGKAEKAANSYDDKSTEDEIRKAYFSYLSALELDPNSNTNFGSKLQEFGIHYNSLSGNDIDGYTVIVTLKSGDEKIYEIDGDGTINNSTIKWKQGTDGNITDGNETIQIGDYVNYETILPTVTVNNDTKFIKDLQAYSGETEITQNTANNIIQEKNISWRVLDIKNGKIRLISDTPTTSMIKLVGENGYNNGVYLLNEICDNLYSARGIGKAQNLKIEDIEEKIDKSKFDYTQYIGNDGNEIISGQTKEYTSNLYYPMIYKYEKGCKALSTTNSNIGYLDKSEQEKLVTGKAQAVNKIVVTQNYWYSSGYNISTQYKNSIYYELFNKKGENNYSKYLIASRILNCLENYVSYELYMIDYSNISSQNLYNSKNIGSYGTFSLRPVVVLNADVEFTGKVNNIWQIKQ